MTSLFTGVARAIIALFHCLVQEGDLLRKKVNQETTHDPFFFCKKKKPSQVGMRPTVQSAQVGLCPTVHSAVCRIATADLHYPPALHRENSEHAQMSEAYASEHAQKPKVSDEPHINEWHDNSCHQSMIGGF